MRVTLRSKRTKVALSILTALAVSSCGRTSGEKKSSSSSEVETSLQTENKVSDDKVILAFSSNTNGANFQCLVEVVKADQTAAATPQWSACASSGLTVPLPAGSLVTVSVKAVDANGKEDPSPLVLQYQGPALAETVKPQAEPANPVPANPVPALPAPAAPGNGQGGQYGYPVADQWAPFALTSLNLGSSWSFQVPDGMHVLQYAANYGLGTGVDVLQIMQGQDRNYFGIYPGSFRTDNGCSRFANQAVGVRSPSGEVLGYCAGKVNGKAQVKKMFGGEYAVNHIEVGSDENSAIQKRMLIQVYKNYAPGKSIIKGLCNDQPNVSGYNEIFGAMPVMHGFWAYDRLRDNIRTCRVVLNGFNGGRWQVAGFVFTPSDYCNSDGCQGSRKALEVVYMERNERGMTRYSDYFARDFQSLIYDTLGQENPYMPF